METLFIFEYFFRLEYFLPTAAFMVSFMGGTSVGFAEGRVLLSYIRFCFAFYPACFDVYFIRFVSLKEESLGICKKHTHLAAKR